MNQLKHRLLLLWSFCLFLCFLWISCSSPLPNQEHNSRRVIQKSPLLSNVKLEGVLEVEIADDFTNNRHWYQYYLRHGNSLKSTRLHFQKQPAFALKTGQLLSLEGNFTNTHFVVQKLNLKPIGEKPTSLYPTLRKGLFENPLILPDHSTPTPILNASAPIKRTVAVLIVNLKDKAAFNTSKTYLESLVFTKANDVYDKSTFGLIQFLPDADKDKKADIFGPFTINDTSASDCKQNNRKWRSEANKLAAASGVVLSRYNHLIYIMPNLKSCGWAGVATVGNLFGRGPYPMSIRTEGSKPRVTAHELGHSIGMGHSSLDPNNDGVHDKNKPGEEYGDHSCFMGIRLANLNAPHMVQIGTFERFTKSIIFAKPGTTKYKVYPLLNNPSKALGPQVIMFPNLALNRVYYLSYKKGQFYDQATNSKYKTGVTIQHHSLPRTSRTYYVKTLKNAEVFKDKSNFEIKQIAKGANNSFVEIEVKIPPVDPNCKTAPPVITGPSVINTGLRKSFTLKLTVENKNNAACGKTMFRLEQMLPGQYRLTSPNYNKRKFMLLPGAKSTISTIIVNDGTSRNVTMTLVDLFPGSLKPVKKTILFRVDANAPTPPSNLQGKLMVPRSVRLTWSKSTDKGTGLARYQILRQVDGNGNFSSAGYAANNRLYFVDKKIPANAKVVSYYVVAYDRTFNSSKPSNTVRVTLPVTGKEPTPEASTEKQMEATKEATKEGSQEKRNDEGNEGRTENPPDSEPGTELWTDASTELAPEIGVEGNPENVSKEDLEVVTERKPELAKEPASESTNEPNPPSETKPEPSVEPSQESTNKEPPTVRDSDLQGDASTSSEKPVIDKTVAPENPQQTMDVPPNSSACGCDQGTGGGSIPAILACLMLLLIVRRPGFQG